MEKKRVLVAMSGGVDSSAAALLLQQQGYACDGAMLKLYSGEVEGTCCSADDADDARSVAYRLGMKFYVFNETERFARDVMDHFVAEYCAGHTPNPCIDCNRCLKFGALLERALVLGYDYLATGHYARVGYDPETGLYRLLRGRDRRKDQSYVLYQLTQHQLSHLLQYAVVNAPVRRILPIQLLWQQLIQPGEKLKSIRRAIQHIGQTQIIGMFIQMPIMIAYETDRATGDGIGLPIKHMNTRAMFDNHNFMKIMMMFRKIRLREPGFYRHGRVTRRKKIHTM